MRALIHVGLAALVVIAPALCCCNLHYIVGSVAASHASCPATPQSESIPPIVAEPPSCCHHEVTPAKECCPANKPPERQADPKPKPQCPACERADTLPPQPTPEIAAAEPTGKLLLDVFRVQTGIPLEHLALIGGLDPPERAGVDTRYESLFLRHVLRC